MDTLIQDIRFGLRTFIRQPAFALTAALAIALGIGANTAVFSVVYAGYLPARRAMKVDPMVALRAE